MNIDFIVIKTVARTMKTVVKIMFVQVHKKAALPIIRMDAAFLLLSSETVSRFPSAKTLLTLDLNTMKKTHCKYKVYLLNTQEL